MRLGLADIGIVRGQVGDEPVATGARGRTGATPTNVLTVTPASTTTPAPTAASNISSVLSVPGPSGPYMDPNELTYVQEALSAGGINPATATAAQIQAAAAAYGNAAWVAATGGASGGSATGSTGTGSTASATPTSFSATGYIDPQGNLWLLGASGQVGGPDATEIGPVSTLPSGVQGHTQVSSGYLLLDSTGYALTAGATSGSTSGVSTSTLLLIAAGIGALFLASKH